MALADSESIKELFSAFGPITVRRMFGGAGIFAAGLMIGLISNDEIFLKADALTAPSFEAEGMKPFTYGARQRRVVMSFWRMPERLLDDPDDLAQWAKAALGAAQRSAAKRTKMASPTRRRAKTSVKTRTGKKRKVRSGC